MTGNETKVALRIEVNKKAIDRYRISGNTTELASTFKALGELYRAQGKTDLAFEAMGKGLAAVEERSS